MPFAEIFPHGRLPDDLPVFVCPSHIASPSACRCITEPPPFCFHEPIDSSGRIKFSKPLDQFALSFAFRLSSRVSNIGFFSSPMPITNKT